METDTCRSCGEPMEAGRRRQRFTCTPRCRAAYSRRRRAESATRDAERALRVIRELSARVAASDTTEV